MASSLGEQLINAGERLSAVGSLLDDPSIRGPLDVLHEAAEEVGLSWSGSSLGYHASVYYSRFQVPPPGVHFNQEWGLMLVSGNNPAGWEEFAHDTVIAKIQNRAGNPDLAHCQNEASAVEQVFRDSQDDVLSMLDAILRHGRDSYLEGKLVEVKNLVPLTYEEYIDAQIPAGTIASRDRVAMGQGRRPAPHQEVIARVSSIRSPFVAAFVLAGVCRGAARHLERVGGDDAPTSRAPADGRIVICHGRSLQWRALKDFVADRLGMPWDEFNRVAIAGVTTVDRLQQMADGSAMALLVATAEDEQADGELSARQNVIHEIGLFQGRLGFSRAIVLLEDGCAEFSNIHGLGQIRFPNGNIAATFEEVRRVLEREGLL